jgi:conjugal transfer/entry exclusion protein
VQDLINSFVRLSAAMSVYTLQQMQSAVGTTIDPKDSVAKLKKMIDSMTEALTAQIDETKKQTMDDITNLGSGVVERTFDTVTNFNPREVVQNASDVVRKTTDSVAEMMKSDKTEEKKSASTPQAVGEVLAAH